MDYFCSDTHFGHANILRYCDRPFKDTQEMDNTMLKNLSVLKTTDTLYFLGDFTMRDDSSYKWFHNTINKIPGRKIMILGNHDKLKPFKYVECGFESVHTSLVVDDLFLAHDPAWIAVMPKEYTMICGHVHGLFKTKKDNVGRLAINVGVDVWDFKPVSMDEIMEIKIFEENQNV